MAKVEMTDKEKALLDLAYTDGERIFEGKLFDYQEKALAELRAMSFYLKKKYPDVDLEIISFRPASQKSGAEAQFIQPGLDATEYLLKFENGKYVDNFYDVPFEREYDAIVEGILKEGGIDARVYTTFPFLISADIKSGRELMDHRPFLGRTSQLFIMVDELPDDEHAEAVSEKVQAIFNANSVYGSGMIFFLQKDAVPECESVLDLDAYARNRKNLHNIVSTAYRCFHVK
ncbi:MAG: hypothetical protein J5546_05520 [Lachnospiraceae bacterium]|nr:hypothetical protein [Lachnospiraceae bacterium]